MERIRELNCYQKAILILLAVMLVVFTVLYTVSYSRLGFDYGGHILVPHEENGGTVYTGKIRGTETSITVTGDHTVTVRYGSKTYGPYTAREDPAAVPEDGDLKAYMTGVEIRDGSELFFRGGVVELSDTLVLFDEDGGHSGMNFTVVMSNGTELDQYGNAVDHMKPSAVTILELLRGPELTRKGEWMAWVMGLSLTVMTSVSILFADELFRWNLSFRVRDPEGAEPSEWEMAQRYIGWTVLPIAALVLYVIGLL